jgi:ubiquinone biosynthesis monooxygenase Coq7
MLDTTVGPRDALTIARIVRVNHAGEYGAIRIYGAQIAISRWLFPDFVADLEDILAHEVRHCRIFRDAMPARHARPCRVMAFWSLGGSVLGACTALMGRQALWACTAAVEAAVHRHLEDQLHFLAGRDAELHAAILDIREEELSHLNHAEAQLTAPNLFRRLLRHVISVLTDMLIWLSTWGDSSRMARELRKSA